MWGIQEGEKAPKKDSREARGGKWVGGQSFDEMKEMKNDEVKGTAEGGERREQQR